MNLEEIKELIKVFGESELGRLKLKNGKFEILMSKDGEDIALAPTSAVSTPAPALVSEPQETTLITQNEATEIVGDVIKSPMVGTFYASPSPDSPPFVTEGDTVRKGQTLCILEAMKIMNELEAEYDCKILEVLVKDGEPIEYDTPLFRVEKL